MSMVTRHMFILLVYHDATKNSVDMHLPLLKPGFNNSTEAWLQLNYGN